MMIKQQLIDKKNVYKVINIIYDERFGGPHRRVIEIANNINKKFESFVLLPKCDQELISRLQRNRIKVYQIDLVRIRTSWNPLNHIKWIIYFWLNIIQIYNIIQSSQVDIVHTNGILNIQAAIAAKLANTKLVWQLNDILIPRFLLFFLVPVLSLTADEIIASSKAVSEYHFRHIPKFLRRDCTIIYPPVDLQKFNCINECNTNNSFLIGSVGNINPIKNYKTLIEAARIIGNKIPNIKFIVIGRILENRKSHYKELLAMIKENKLEDRFCFLGYQDHIVEYLKNISIYVHTSLSEAFGLAIAEAMSLAKPVVVAKVGGVPEVVGSAGILISPKDPIALAKAIIFLWENPGKAKRIGNKARNRVKDLFALDICIQKHQDLYQNLV